MANKIAIVGPKIMTNPFSLIGITPFPVDYDSNVEIEIEKIEKEITSFAMVFVTENMAEQYPEKFDEMGKKTNIVLIPDYNGSSGYFKESIAKLIKKATGELTI